mgnify:CR=1 FL=1
MITVSQEEYIRMLDLLKYQANFILKNTNVNKINEQKTTNAETERNIIEYLNMCNDLLVTFEQYIVAKDKYQLSDSYLKELNETKSGLDEFVNSNWNVEELVGTRTRWQGDCSDKRLKENIVLLGTTDENIKVYQFNYIFDPMKVKHVGVIAQELLETKYKNNVYLHEDGFYRVDYKHLDMTFDGQQLPFLAK